MRTVTKEPSNAGGKGTAMRMAYVLITAEAGRAEGVIRALRSKRGVKTAHALSGPYDVIALIEGPRPEDVARMVLAEVPGIEGVQHVKTCLVRRVKGDTEMTGE